jgi:hypothetical protein
MFFLDLKGLVKRLSREPLSTKESLQYFFAFICMNVGTTAVSAFNPRGSSNAPGGWAAGLISLGVGAVVLFIVWNILLSLYNANGGDSGKDFLSNLFAVGWVVIFRTTAVVMPVMGAFVLLTAFTTVRVTNQTYFLVLALIGLIVLMIWNLQQIAKALKDIRVNQSSRDEA